MKGEILMLLLVATAGCLGGMGDTAPTGEAPPEEETPPPMEEPTSSNETNDTITEATDTTTETRETEMFKVRADDNGYYRDGSEISSISIPEGSSARITFRVEGDTYFGGLDFRSSVFNSPTVEPGEEWTSPEFTMGESFTVSSFWPESDKHKADLAVNPG